MKKKIIMMGIITVMLIIIGISFILAVMDADSNSDESHPNQQQGVVNGETSNQSQGNQEEDIIDSNKEKSKLYITEEDVILDGGFEIINTKSKEVIKEFARMTLLGYGGNACLEDIKEINDRIFTEESPDREDYISRMEAYEAGKHDNYLKGYSEVKFCGDYKKDNTSQSFTVRIDHILTVYDAETDLQTDTIKTSVMYTLLLVTDNGNVYIESCEPNKHNAFDGELGSGKVDVPGAIIDISNQDMKVLEEVEQLTEEEKEILGKFYALVVYAMGGEMYRTDVEAVYEEIFWPESEKKYDYSERIKKRRSQYEMVSNIWKVQDISETEKEKTIELSVCISQYSKSGEKSGFENIYWLTLKEIDNKVYIVSCIPHELNLYE